MRDFVLALSENRHIVQLAVAAFTTGLIRHRRTQWED
jgi:hypothetical protein